MRVAVAFLMATLGAFLLGAAIAYVLHRGAAVTLSDALVIARKRGRGVRRKHWNSRWLVIAWDELWLRAKEWKDSTFAWTPPRTWTPTLAELLADDWETCRP